MRGRAELQGGLSQGKIRLLCAAVQRQHIQSSILMRNTKHLWGLIIPWCTCTFKKACRNKVMCMVIALISNKILPYPKPLNSGVDCDRKILYRQKNYYELFHMSIFCLCFVAHSILWLKYWAHFIIFMQQSISDPSRSQEKYHLISGNDLRFWIVLAMLHSGSAHPPPINNDIFLSDSCILIKHITAYFSGLFALKNDHLAYSSQ